MKTAKIIAAIVCYLPSLSFAQVSYSICFEQNEGDVLCAGVIELTAKDSGFDYRIDWDAAQFSKRFLSMRPFNCLDAADFKLWCHLPYPYELDRSISKDDLTDLEYDLLFIEKGATEYGIDPWHGRYYRLRWSDGDIVGSVHEVDLNVLAVPPEPGVLRPIEPSEIHETDLAKQWLPTISIRKQ